MTYRSWGYSPAEQQAALKPSWQKDIDLTVAPMGDAGVLPFGNGRSYGDSCLNSGGTLVDTSKLNRFIAFDKENGILEVESGLKLHEILAVIVPHGWFLPVVPGTSMVTVGGAIANDIHGKNHHCEGTFGVHVDSFVIQRSEGPPLCCSASENASLYSATIGGLGLTGLVLSARLRLKRITSSNMDVFVKRFNGLDEFTQLSATLSQSHAYTVAWLDCISTGDDFARGVFLAANHADTGELQAAEHAQKLSVPFNLPAITLNKLSLKAFNQLYYARHASIDDTVVSQGYKQYFFPLDSIGNWNRIYGSAGFYQYQFVIPRHELACLNAIVKEICLSGLGSFLAVLKEFGSVESPGMLSFPREGYCLALDFAHRKHTSRQLIERLDNMVRQSGGAVYPAKDRLMTSTAFKQYFSRYDEFLPWVDKNFSSDFWRRVNA